MRDLTTLEHLDLYSGIKFETEDSGFLKSLTRLQSLALSTSSEFDINVLEKMPQLSSYYGRVSIFPENGGPLEKLKNLSSLRLSNKIAPTHLDRLNKLGTFKHLRALILTGPDMIPLESISNLDHIYISPGDTAKPFDTSFLDTENKIWKVDLPNVDDQTLNMLSHRTGSEKIEELQIFELMATDLSHLTKLKDLRILQLYGARKSEITSIKLPPLPGLQFLRIRNFPKLSKIEGLANLPALEELKISNLPELTDTGPTPRDTNRVAHSLSIDECPKLENLSAFYHLNGLTFLYITDSPKVKDFDRIKRSNPDLKTAYWRKD